MSWSSKKFCLFRLISGLVCKDLDSKAIRTNKAVLVMGDDQFVWSVKNGDLATVKEFVEKVRRNILLKCNAHPLNRCWIFSAEFSVPVQLFLSYFLSRSPPPLPPPGPLVFLRLSDAQVHLILNFDACIDWLKRFVTDMVTHWSRFLNHVKVRNGTWQD